MVWSPAPAIKRALLALLPVAALVAPAPARALLALLPVAALVAPAPALASGGGAGVSNTSPPSGGAPVGGLAPTRKPPRRVPAPPGKHAHGSWLGGVTITEYWPAPESWFVGKRVRAPGIPGKHRVDWLYSAKGVCMEGDGIGLDGRRYHLDNVGDGGWVTEAGTPTSASDGFAAGPPYWRTGGYWRNRGGGVTFPLERGGWAHGVGRHYVPIHGVTFAPGPSLPLHYYQSIAVDPNVIPLGSRVYIPAYKHDGHGGWFIAQDTGGAIKGRHVDVYRTPPASASDDGQYLTEQRIFVVRAHS